MDETASTSFRALPLQLFRPRGRWLNTLHGGILNSDGHDRQRLLNSPSRGAFCLCSRARTGLRTQSFRDLSRRRRHLPQYSNVGRRGRGRRPQFRNLALSQKVFFNGVQSFPFHALGLLRQRLHPSQKLSLGGLCSGRPDGRDFHIGRR